MNRFNPDWRRQKSLAFHLQGNSTARHTVMVDFWGVSRPVYANANLSIYSGQACNAHCPFCVEELRPISRGVELAAQKQIIIDDAVYFAALQAVLKQLAPLNPSVSITGGEATLDPRLPKILFFLKVFRVRNPTLTTNGSGLLMCREGRQILDWIAASGIRHLNLSRAHVDDQHNGRIMGLDVVLDLKKIIARAKKAGIRLRLSCVLLQGEVEEFSDVLNYLTFARSLGVDNVIFRQLMAHNPDTVLPSPVATYCLQQSVKMDPILEALEQRADFIFKKQVMGYYYYVEVWQWQGIDVVFESADLARLEWSKQADAITIHELVFHPNGQLASTWQPWDGVLGPPDSFSSHP